MKNLVILFCGFTRASIETLTSQIIEKYQISFIENKTGYVLVEPGINTSSNGEIGKIGEFLKSFDIKGTPELNKVIGIYDPENIEHLKEIVKISGEIWFERERDGNLSSCGKVLVKFIDQQKVPSGKGGRIEISENGLLIAGIDACIANGGYDVVFVKDKKNFKNTKTITTAFKSAEYGELHGVN